MALKILSIKNSCTGCGACVSICPKHALTLTYNIEGFYYPTLNEDLCIDCKSCERVCHVLKNDLPTEPERTFTPIMLKAKSKTLVAKSSSGGIFSLLADYVISNGGVVFGARYNFDLERLEHVSTDQCSLDELRKSKYIESYLGNVFADVKINLKKGRQVLFCGTPCQVKGLSTYLDIAKIAKDNLFLIRFICHGVPANKFFTEYKHYIEKKVGAKMTYVDFRPKTHGWCNTNILMKFKNNVIINQPYTHNYYYHYYYSRNNYLLRPACYNCKQLLQETGDITIADFWGIRYYKPNLNDNEGISLAFLQSDKAKLILNKISNNCNYEFLPQSSVDYIYADSSVKETLFSERDKFVNEVLKHGYMDCVKKVLAKKILKLKVKAEIKRIIKKFLYGKK